MAKKCHGNDRKKAINEVEKYTMKGNKKEQKAQKGRGIFQEKNQYFEFETFDAYQLNEVLCHFYLDWG